MLPGGGVLLYKGLMGTCGQPVYVFGDFCLKQGIDSIILCLNQGIDFINFGFKRFIFSWTIDSLRVRSTNETTAKFLFFIVIHRVWFRNKCLKQVSKIGILS